jgi:uncharacterized membrane protein YphA (DoxX/SURF4 family)
MTTTQKIIYYVLLVLVSVLFLFSGYSKLSSDPMAVAGFAQAHLPLWFMYFIGAAEVLGAIGLWIPKLAKWATYGLYIILAGAVVTTIIFVSTVLALMPLATAIVLYIITRLRTKKSMAPMASTM